jgi:hypothetical protein
MAHCGFWFHEHTLSAVNNDNILYLFGFVSVLPFSSPGHLSFPCITSDPVLLIKGTIPVLCLSLGVGLLPMPRVNHGVMEWGTFLFLFSRLSLLVLYAIPLDRKKR